MRLTDQPTTRNRAARLLGRLGVAVAPALVAVMLAFAAGFLQFPSARAESMSPAQKAEIEKIIRDYLLANPEVLFEARDAYERKQEAAQMAAMKQAIGQNKDALFKNPRAPAVAAKDADVTIVEFFDYNCSYCRHAVAEVGKLVSTDKKVRVVFKEFPIFGKDSEDAARFALAADKQGKYWDMHLALYERKGQDKADAALARELAKGLGLDMAKLEADAYSQAVTDHIAEVRKLAEGMGIQGTPHFIIGETVIPGAPRNLLEVMSTEIANVRKNGCAVC
jgi:protein-disulfide isomerase